MTMIQSESFSEEIQEEILLESKGKDKSEINLWNKIKSFFRKIPLAQFQTPLHFENNRGFSTFWSGLISLLVVLGLIIIGILTLIPVIQKSQYYLTKKVSDIEKYSQTSLDSTQYWEKKNCKKCTQYSMNESSKFFEGNFFFLITNSQINSNQTCEEKFEVYLSNNFIDSKGLKNTIHTGSFLKGNKKNSNVCQFSFEQSKIMNALSSEYHNQSAIFYEVVEANQTVNYLPYYITIVGMSPDTLIVRTAAQPEFSEAGLTLRHYVTEYSCKNCSHILDYNEIIQYENYESILPVAFQKKESKLYYQQQNYYPINFEVDNDPTDFQIYFAISNNLNNFQRYPQGILLWISSMGGFIAFAKLMLLSLQFFNQYHFKRSIKMKNQEYKELYSLEKFKEIAQKVEQQEQINSQIEFMVLEIQELKKENIELKKKV